MFVIPSTTSEKLEDSTQLDFSSAPSLLSRASALSLQFRPEISKSICTYRRSYPSNNQNQNRGANDPTNNNPRQSVPTPDGRGKGSLPTLLPVRDKGLGPKKMQGRPNVFAEPYNPSRIRYGESKQIPTVESGQRVSTKLTHKTPYRIHNSTILRQLLIRIQCGTDRYVERLRHRCCGITRLLDHHCRQFETSLDVFRTGSELWTVWCRRLNDRV